MTTVNMLDVGLSGSTGTGAFVGSTSPTLVTPASLGVQQQALNMNSHLINNLVDPSAAQDAATKNYVDSSIAGLNPNESVTAASTVALTVTYNNGTAGTGATLTNAGAMVAIGLDGVSPTVGKRVLIKDQASTLQNGVYVVTTVGSGAANWVLTRAADFDTPENINDSGTIDIINGSTLAGTIWYQTATVTAVGTDPITFLRFGTSFVTGPGSATDRGIAIYNGTTGKIIQNSTATIDLNNNAVINGAMFGSGYGTRNTYAGEAVNNTGATITECTLIGFSAGIGIVASSDYNTAVGSFALGAASISGDSNTAIGRAAMIVSTSADNNCCVGSGSLVDLTTGDNNTSMGTFSSGSFATGSVSLISGSTNTFLGFQASSNNAASVGVLAIGANAVADIATGATSADDGPGISIGSVADPVGFRGDATIYPTAGAISGYAKVKWNGTFYKIALYALA